MKNKEILFIILLSLILCYPVISIHISENKQSDIYKNAVEEYNAININPYFNTKEAYEMGLNSLGKPIFKNAKGAFKQAMSDFKKSCEFLETELQFGTVCSTKSMATSMWRRTSIWDEFIVYFFECI